MALSDAQCHEDAHRLLSGLDCDDDVDGATPTFRTAVFDADGVFWTETFLEDAASAPAHPLPDFTPILRVIEKFLGGK